VHSTGVEGRAMPVKRKGKVGGFPSTGVPKGVSLPEI